MAFSHPQCPIQAFIHVYLDWFNRLLSGVSWASLSTPSNPSPAALPEKPVSKIDFIKLLFG